MTEQMKCGNCRKTTLEFMIPLKVPVEDKGFNYVCRKCFFTWIFQNQQFAFSDDDRREIRAIVDRYVNELPIIRLHGELPEDAGPV